ncbi:MAG: BamA/TamA family outer membrane protein [Bacteroidetes bacterium]|nr:BamA/TamA family outer membrane protein [Bacteroidota bacterium]
MLLLPCIYAAGQTTYTLSLRGLDKDSAQIVRETGIQTSFPSRIQCADYINKLTGLLQAKGFVTASVDSVIYETTHARIILFTGKLYRWAVLDAHSVDPALLDAAGWREKMFSEKPLDFSQVQFIQGKILDRLENTGYPFANVFLDSLQLDDDKVSALLKVVSGPAYRIDSIRIIGNAKITAAYLQRYLDIPNGSTYNREKLSQVNKRIRELSYLEEVKPADLTMLATGSILNLYLRQKRSSQVNVLLGFLPNNDQLSDKKLLLTGEANILLRNAFGAGETIGLNWQQIQVNSPRLNLLYQHPYLFRSPFGIDFSFDIFKKDSNFLNVNMQLGAAYALNNRQSGKLFFQRFQTIVSAGGVNPALIIQSRRLPDVADVSSLNLGLDYEYNSTDYRLNPRKGNQFRIITSIGTKTLKKNNEILELKDPNDPGYNFEKLYDTIRLKTYQLRVRATATRFLPLGRQSTLKTEINAGLFQSGNTFRNELFQLGGYKLLRGFDEESQYLSHFVIGTLEYRLLYLTGQNSFLYALLDGGWGQNNSAAPRLSYTYIGTGLGIAFETKAGIFNLAWAVGKRNDTNFNLRQSKIHLGFVNYF